MAAPIMLSEDSVELRVLLSQLETPQSRSTQYSCISRKQVETVFESFYVFCISLCHQLELLQVVQFCYYPSFTAVLPLY